MVLKETYSGSPSFPTRLAPQGLQGRNLVVFYDQRLNRTAGFYHGRAVSNLRQIHPCKWLFYPAYRILGLTELDLAHLYLDSRTLIRTTARKLALLSELLPSGETLSLGHMKRYIHDNCSRWCFSLAGF